MQRAWEKLQGNCGTSGMPATSSTSNGIPLRANAPGDVTAWMKSLSRAYKFGAILRSHPDAILPAFFALNYMDLADANVLLLEVLLCILLCPDHLVLGLHFRRAWFLDRLLKTVHDLVKS